MINAALTFDDPILRQKYDDAQYAMYKKSPNVANAILDQVRKGNSSFSHQDVADAYSVVKRQYNAQMFIKGPEAKKLQGLMQDFTKLFKSYKQDPRYEALDRILTVNEQKIVGDYPDYYQIFKVSYRSSPEEVLRSYGQLDNQLAQLPTTEHVTRARQALETARKTLTDPTLRAHYHKAIEVAQLKPIEQSPIKPSQELGSWARPSRIEQESPAGILIRHGTNRRHLRHSGLHNGDQRQKCHQFVRQRPSEYAEHMWSEFC